MAKEYTELQVKARDAGITSWHTKSEDTLMKDLGLMSDPVKEDSKPKAKETDTEAPAAPERVTFYWKNGRNQTILIVTQEATKDKKKQSVAIASKKGVLILDPSNPVEAKAIARLRKMPKYKKEFDEVNSRKVVPSEKGARIDELMELDQKTLAQMAGGTVPDFRKTKGELIAELTA